MATPDKLPAEANVERNGPQLSAQEARRLAAEAGTVPGVGTPEIVSEREVRGQLTREDLGGGASRGASGSTGNDRRHEEAPDQHPYAHASAALGDADTVQKTTWGVGSGTEPDGRRELAKVGMRKGEGTAVARTSAGGGLNPVAWLVGALALLVALAYGFNVFS